ncbi:MAG: BCCT family transporter [Desulfobacterales bacterium]
MAKNPVLILSLILTGGVAGWGIVDTAGLAAFASTIVGFMFTSRGWFIMLSATFFVFLCLGLAFSRYGKIKLGKDDDEPEFSTISWITMLFAAGMGVGLLYFGSAEPLFHFMMLRPHLSNPESAQHALFATNFHWGLHAWAIYAITGLIIAYFSFRKDQPTLISAPIRCVFGDRGWPRWVGGFSDLMAITAIAIGVGGSIAMGVFQVQAGVAALFNLENPGVILSVTIFVLLVVSFLLPLTVDLGKGMALLSNTAMAIAGGLMLFVIITGPTHYIMSAIVGGLGDYLSRVLPHGFKTFTFFDETIGNWFQSWTLTYMVWWLAWSPFVGVFIARISKGRTIKEYILGVVLVPTMFSIVWFGVFGSIGFYGAMVIDVDILEVVRTNIDTTTFFVLDHLPFAKLTIAATVLAAFLFVVTSVVSAAFVLSMFSSKGDADPTVKTKLMWGVILGALGLVMIFSNSIDAVKSIIALGALPFVYIVLLISVCLLKALKKETML